MEAGGKSVLVDLLDPLAEGVVAVGGGLRCGLAGDEAVVAVVGEAAGRAADGVAVRALDAGVAAALVQPVAAGRAVDVAEVAGVAGFDGAVAIGK